MKTRYGFAFTLLFALAAPAALAQTAPPKAEPPAPPAPEPPAPAPDPPTPAPAPPPPAAPAPAPAKPPAPKAGAQKPPATAAKKSTGKKTGAGVSASTRTDGPKRRPRQRSDDFERRVVVFTDGQSPKIVSGGERFIHGPLELEVRFENANPLCYAYSTNIGASHVAASDQPLPIRVPGIGALGAQSAATFAGLDEAFSAVASAENEIDEILHAARFQVSLDDVWAACDAGGEFDVQRGRVEAAAKTAEAKLGRAGHWREVLERAQAVALGSKRLARELEMQVHEAAQEVESKKSTLEKAEAAERQLQERAEGAGRRQLQPELDEAQRDIASAQRQLREAELQLSKHRRATDLARSAERLEERVQHAITSLSSMVADLNRARALLARSPTAIRRRFGSGETISVVVERTRLEEGQRVEGRAPQRFEVPEFETVRPIILDIGLGPVLSLGENTSKYETVFTPRSADDNTPAYRTVRTEQGLDLDVMISISVYLWKRRYLDEGVFDPWQLIPRPLVGISLDRPFDAIYAGAQIDPIQYLNIGGGVRIANSEQLVGPQPLDRALIDSEGDPQPPVTRDEIKAMGFVSLTVSTNLVYRWFKQGL